MQQHSLLLRRARGCDLLDHRNQVEEELRGKFDMLTPKFLTKFTAIVGTFAFLFLTVGCSAPNPGASGTVRADSPSAVPVTCKLPSPHGSVSGVSEGQCKSLLKIAGCATPGAVVGDTMKCSTTNKPK